MIMYPLSELMKRVDCRYTLVIVAAKRARMLTEHKQVSPLDDFDPEDNSQRAVEVAIKEIMEGRIGYVRNDENARREIDALHMRRQYEMASIDMEDETDEEEERDEDPDDEIEPEDIRYEEEADILDEE
jgi:DNA-directed RNA polymerase subunit omega